MSTFDSGVGGVTVRRRTRVTSSRTWRSSRGPRSAGGAAARSARRSGAVVLAGRAAATRGGRRRAAGGIEVEGAELGEVGAHEAM